MFKRSLIIFFLLAVLCAFSIYYTCFFILPKDIKAYEENVKKQEKKKEKDKKISSSEQIRIGVSKEIWTPQADTSLYSRIEAKHSSLHMLQKGHDIKLTERLEDVRCLLQDRISKTSSGQQVQHVKTFSGKEGFYDYGEKTFISQKVYLSFFTLEGTTLPNEIFLYEPLMQGLAKQATVSFKDHHLSFKAESFRADVSSKEIVR